MSKYIGIGRLSHFNFYILYRVLAKFLSDIIIGFKKIYTNSDNNSIFQINPVLDNHILIQELYKYIGYIILGSIMYLYSKKQNNNNLNNENKIITNETTTNNEFLIYNENEKELNPKISCYKFILFCFLYVLYEVFIDISYYLGFLDLDLWVFNIIFTSLFMTKLLNKPFFNHQKYSLTFVVFTNIISMILIIFKFQINNPTEELLGNKLYSIFICIIFIINSLLISYTRVIGKILMDLKNISLYPIILFIGIIGFILISIFLILTSIFQCHESHENIENNINDNGKAYFCKIQNKNTLLYYFDSFPVYISELKNININKGTYAFLIEIIAVTPLKICFLFFVLNFEMLIIYYLNPIYVLVSDCFYYGILAALSLQFPENKEKNIIILIADILAIFSYLIYLEIIELKFCDLDKNIRISIIQRGILDTKIKINDDETDEGEEEENDDDNQNNENNDNVELQEKL